MSVINVGPSYLTHAAGLPLEVAQHVNVMRRQETLRTMNGGDLTATRLVALLNNGVRDAETLLTMGARNLGPPSNLLARRFFRCDSITHYVQPDFVGLAPAHAYFNPGPEAQDDETQYKQMAQHVAVGNVNELVGRYFQLSRFSAPTRVYWYAYMMPNTDIKISVTSNYAQQTSTFEFQGQTYTIDGYFF